jgi:histidyl-tRNA synthetase
MGQAEAAASMRIIKELRRAGISAEIYPDAAKMKKQMSYADSRAIPYVAIVGESEMASGQLTLKDMRQGTQQTLTPAEAIALLKA